MISLDTCCRDSDVREESRHTIVTLAKRPKGKLTTVGDVNGLGGIAQEKASEGLCLVCLAEEVEEPLRWHKLRDALVDLIQCSGILLLWVRW